MGKNTFTVSLLDMEHRALEHNILLTLFSQMSTVRLEAAESLAKVPQAEGFLPWASAIVSWLSYHSQQVRGPEPDCRHPGRQAVWAGAPEFCTSPYCPRKFLEPMTLGWWLPTDIPYPACLERNVCHLLKWHQGLSVTCSAHLCSLALCFACVYTWVPKEREVFNPHPPFCPRWVRILSPSLSFESYPLFQGPAQTFHKAQTPDATCSWLEGTLPFSDYQ